MPAAHLFLAACVMAYVALRTDHAGRRRRIERLAEARVVLRTFEQIVIAIDGAPRAAAIVRPIERRLLHLDQRINALGQ